MLTRSIIDRTARESNAVRLTRFRKLADTKNFGHNDIVIVALPSRSNFSDSAGVPLEVEPAPDWNCLVALAVQSSEPCACIRVDLAAQSCLAAAEGEPTYC